MNDSINKAMDDIAKEFDKAGKEKESEEFKIGDDEALPD